MFTENIKKVNNIREVDNREEVMKDHQLNEYYQSKK